jgi:hypothetical protein
MSGQYYEPNSSHIVERAQYSNNQVVNLDPFIDTAPINEAFIHEAAMAETVPVVSPINDTVVNETPVVETIPSVAPIGEILTLESPTINTDAGSLAPLFSRDESEHFRARWNEIQGKFVDEPSAGPVGGLAGI